MTAVLADEDLHRFIGGRPATNEELRDRYRRLVAGSPNPAQVWLNWIVRDRHDSTPMGTVQATVTNGQTGWTAEVAWIIGTPWQSQGYATEAAGGLVDWLCGLGVHTIDAHIHPAHHASAAVAQRAGLVMTDVEVDGERVWRRHVQPA